MSIFKIFSGPSAEKREQKGDALAAAGKWGRAKIAYEDALASAEKEAGAAAGQLRSRVREKLASAKESLAREHLENADMLLEGGNFDEAAELVAIALEMTAEPQLRRKLKERRERIERQRVEHALDDDPDPLYGLGDEEDDPEAEDSGEDEPASVEETFEALCSTLPPEVEAVYRTFDGDFREGYVALNRGDFDEAVGFLSRSLENAADPDSYIALELATARFHQGEAEAAQSLLEPFVQQRPEVLPALQLLCEIHWEAGDFDQARALIDAVPENLRDSVAVYLLRGETRLRSGDPGAAKTGYLEFFDAHGWNDAVAGALAAVHEALGEVEQGRALYKEMMSRCTGCGARVDPDVKQRYAELTFASGLRDADLAEIYLSLAREVPEQAPVCFTRLSRIYADQGNMAESRRFAAFAARAEKESQEMDAP